MQSSNLTHMAQWHIRKYQSLTKSDEITTVNYRLRRRRKKNYTRWIYIKHVILWNHIILVSLHSNPWHTGWLILQIHVYKKKEKGCFSYLWKRSFNSCSEQKGPRLATKRVEQGLLFAAPWLEFMGPPLPTGLPSTGLAARCWWCMAALCVIAPGWPVMPLIARPGWICGQERDRQHPRYVPQTQRPACIWLLDIILHIPRTGSLMYSAGCCCLGRKTAKQAAWPHVMFHLRVRLDISKYIYTTTFHYSTKKYHEMLFTTNIAL